MTTRRWVFVTLAGFALLLVVGRWLSGVYAEWTWYVSMDALPLYKSRLMHQAALRGGAALAGFLLAFANLYAVRSSIVSLVLPRRLANLEIGEAVPGRALTGLVVMAHLAEDKLYYARLLCMELEGELTNSVLAKKSAADIADCAKRHQIAKVYFGRRLEEKLTEDWEIPG